MKRLGYRVTQFWLGLTARPLDDQQAAAVRPFLSDAEWGLFQRFTPNDQQHSFRVWALLKENGHETPALLTAALLHDIGKTRTRLSLIDRTIAVVGRVFFKTKAQAWGRTDWEQATWVQRPLVVSVQHPEWGAEMIEAVDGDEMVISLIRRHQTKFRPV